MKSDGARAKAPFLNYSRRERSLGALTQSKKHEEMMMKYFIAMALLAAPLAMAAAPTPAEAGYRDGARCHLVKKTVWKWGKKRTKWVQVCRPRHRHNH